MNTQEQNFITILKDALHPQDHHSSLSAPALVSPDWNQIFSIASKQNLLPFVYNAAAEYATFSEYDEVHPDVFVKATSVMSRQIQKTDAFLNLYRAFTDEEAAEPPIVLKGIVCRSLYKEGQDFRTSGDEDLLVDEANFQRAASVLEECGYHREVTHETHTDILQEVTFINADVGLAIELHINPLGRANDLLSEMNDWFKDVFDKSEYVKILDTQIRVMQPTDEFLFLVLHMFKHFTSTGAGLRMAMDVLLYMEKYYERIDWSYIWDRLKAVRADSYLADLIAMGNQYLGFALQQEKEAVCPETLVDDMMQTGLFGIVNENASETARYTHMAIVNGGSSKFGAVWHMIFPSWKMWTSWRPYLKEKPWMLPVEWVKRVGRYLRSGKKVSVMTESYDAASSRIALLKKYGVI
ncbi:MAG: nucleotidyltransferase family protein [Lachnospiraceae bacterium]|nr:nucleotidyltransferase family protein [Lachnospiraceae bacterium]